MSSTVLERSNPLTVAASLRVEAVSIPWGKRAVLAVLVGLAVGTIVLRSRLNGAVPDTDFDQLWIAARAIGRGRDPYATVLRYLPMPFYYPVPAAVLVLPLTVVPVAWAHAIWAGLSYALLSFGLLSRGWWGLVCLLNYPALEGATHGQWAPALTASVFLPSLAWLAIGKPTTGIAIAGAYLHRTATGRALVVNLAVGAALLTAAFAVQPQWLTAWRVAMVGAHHFTPLVLRPGGVLLLLALLRWRRPEARLLAFLAVVPQTASPYEALPLVVALSTRSEMILFGALSFVGVAYYRSPIVSGGDALTDMAIYTDRNAPMMLITMYLPVLLMVLRRPNADA